MVRGVGSAISTLGGVHVLLPDAHLPIGRWTSNWHRTLCVVRHICGGYRSCRMAVAVDTGLVPSLRGRWRGAWSCHRHGHAVRRAHVDNLGSASFRFLPALSYRRSLPRPVGVLLAAASVVLGRKLFCRWSPARGC